MYDATEFARLRNAFDQIWSDSVTGAPFRTVWARPSVGQTGNAAPLPMDVYATADAFVIVAAAPGLRPEDLSVTCNQGTVVLSGRIGNAAEAEDAKGASWYLHELWHGRFERAVTPPFEVDPARAEATFEHGVLRLVLPKAEHARPQQIPVRFAAQTQPFPQALAADAETAEVAEPVEAAGGAKA
ncbi:MAG: Hsp20/alpha crystallin family protein [Chloroflexota bacterium]